jgi:hypothetical protein
MQLYFVSVHGPRETYFVDEPRIIRLKQEIKIIVILKLSFKVKFFAAEHFSNIRHNSYTIIFVKFGCICSSACRVATNFAQPAPFVHKHGITQILDNFKEKK